MKKTIRPFWVFASMLLIGSTFSLTSCSSDDNNNGGKILTTDVMYGKYEGTMSINDSTAAGKADDTNDGGSTAGINVSATMNNDTIYFDDFPTKEIINSIIKDEETADKIAEAIGKTSYNMAYVPLLAADKDSINFTLKPEPMELTLSVPSDTEGEEQTLHVTVEIEAAGNAVYYIDEKNARFGITATGVTIENGSDQIPVSGFKAVNMTFDMNQTIARYNNR